MGRALGQLLPPLDIADLGCGEGYLTIEASRFAAQGDCHRSIGSGARAGQGYSRAAAARTNIHWKRGELEKLPLKDASVDVALLSQALHHAEDPSKALAEAVRIVRPGGRVLLLDLRRHDEHWVRDRLGDNGWDSTTHELQRLLEGAGLTT